MLRWVSLLCALFAVPPLAVAQEQAQEPPVAVIPMPSGEVTAEMLTAIREAVVAQLGPLVEGREVRALQAPDRLVAFQQCQDAPCIGAQIAALGAVAGVLVRIHREPPLRARNAQPQPVIVSLEVLDPVSGRPRIDPVHLELGEEQLASVAEALAPATAQLASAMPAPPPRSSLLVAVNVDGAAVKVDGAEVGTTPLAPLEVRPGRHVVEIARAGFVARRESIDVGQGEDARLDIVLAVDPTNVALLDADAGGAGTGGPEQPWYTRWYVIAGAGVVLAAILVGVIVIAASGGDDGGQTGGIPVPPIE